jgi:hypothetical protein
MFYPLAHRRRGDKWLLLRLDTESQACMRSGCASSRVASSVVFFLTHAVLSTLNMSHTERAEALLNDFLKENPQFVKVSSTDTPVILGGCSFTQSSPTPRIQYLPGVGGPVPSPSEW